MTSTSDQWQELNQHSRSMILRGHYDQAIQDGANALDLATEIFADPSPELAETHKNLAMAHYYAGSKKELWLDLSVRSLEIAEKIIADDPAVAAVVIYQRAVVLHSYLDYENAEKYYRQALEISRANNNEHVTAKSIGGLGRMCNDTDKIDEGQKYTLEAKTMLDTYLKNLKDKTSDEYLDALYDYAVSTENTGYALMRQGQQEEAIENYVEAVKVLAEFVDADGCPEDKFLKICYEDIERMSSLWLLGDDLDEPLEQLEQLWDRIRDTKFS